MATATLVEGRKKVLSSYQYPFTGKIRIKLSSNIPVDVFILPGDVNIKEIVNPQTASNVPGAISYTKCINLPDLIIPLPSPWQPLGWKLLIGNPNQGSAAISLEVLEG